MISSHGTLSAISLQHQPFDTSEALDTKKPGINHPDASLCVPPQYSLPPHHAKSHPQLMSSHYPFEVHFNSNQNTYDQFTFPKVNTMDFSLSAQASDLAPHHERKLETLTTDYCANETIYHPA